MDSIDKILKGCLNNERFYQYSLYSMFSAKMYGICLRYASSQDEASDILQEGFIKVFEKLGTFRNEGSLEGWIRRIIVNTAIEKIRGGVSFFSLDDFCENGSVNLENLGPGNIEKNELLKVIQKLPRQYRLVFNLCIIEGYDHKEVGVILNINESTSRSNLTRARAILRKNIKEETKAFVKAI